MRNILFLLFFILICNSSVFCSESEVDEPDIEFGKFSRDELERTVYDIDTSASAIILYEKGTTIIDDYFDIEVTRHVRIKILDQDGINYGNIVIPFNSGYQNEEIKDIEGVTAYIDDQGQIIKRKLDSDDIFENEVDNKTSTKSFTLPAMKPGCIIEYKYKTKSEYMSNYPTQWIFQHTIPSLWCEYNTRVPQLVKYAIFTKLIKPLYIDEKEVKKKFYYGVSSRFRIKTDYHRFVMKDIPALKIEPFIKSLNNYCSKLTFQLYEYFSPYPVKVEGVKSWEDVGKELMSYSSFGGVINSAEDISATVEEITAECETDAQKMSEIYKYISNSIKWNGNYSILAKNLEYTLEQKTGNSGDINILLVAMLKDVGIEAYPVVLSTRSNIELYTDFPIVDQLNYVIAFAQIGDHQILLDATDKLRPLSLLPEEALNDIGLLIQDESVQWVRISPSKKDLSLIMVSAEIDSNGSLDGVFSVTNADYSALTARTMLDYVDEEEYVNALLSMEASSITPSSISIKNKDYIDSPLIISAHITSDSYIQTSGNMMYMNHVIGHLDDNPFQSETREYPIEFPYPSDQEYNFTLKIPSGYSFEEYPDSVSISFSANSALYKRDVKIGEDEINIITHFYVKRIYYDSTEYQGLKKFYQKIIDLEKELLIIKKD